MPESVKHLEEQLAEERKAYLAEMKAFSDLLKDRSRSMSSKREEMDRIFERARRCKERGIKIKGEIERITAEVTGESV